MDLGFGFEFPADGMGAGGVDPITQAIANINALGPAWFFYGNNVIVDSGNLEGGTRISQWTDLSGNARHATQSTQDDEPQIINAAGDYRLAFDQADGTSGDALSLSMAFATGLAGLEMVLAVNRTAKAVNDLFSCGGSVFRWNNLSAANDSARVMVGSSANYAALSTSFNRSSACVIGISYNGGGAANIDRLKIYKNNVDQAAVVTYTGTIPATLGTMTPATFARNSGGTLPSSEDWYAGVCFGRTLNSTERGTVDTNLQTLLAFY